MEELKRKARALNEGYNALARLKPRARVITEKSATTNKVAKLLVYMMDGRPVTGRDIYKRFGILSYRDAIYKIQKDYGYEVKHKDFYKNDNYRLWWLADFEEEFVTPRYEG